MAASCTVGQSRTVEAKKANYGSENCKGYCITADVVLPMRYSTRQCLPPSGDSDAPPPLPRLTMRKQVGLPSLEASRPPREAPTAPVMLHAKESMVVAKLQVCCRDQHWHQGLPGWVIEGCCRELKGEERVEEGHLGGLAHQG